MKNVLRFTVAFGALLLLGPIIVHAASQTIANNTVWKDTAGNEILAQSGSMIKVGSTYYWYGYDLNTSNINCYSSGDLKNWTYVGISFNGSGWHGRPEVVYNSSTAKYVMITEAPHTGSVGRNAVAYLTSSTPGGVFTQQHLDNQVFGENMGDHGVFLDTDGTAYLIAVTDDNAVANGTLTLVKLNPDYLSMNSVVKKFVAATGDKREAPYIVKRNGTYYLFSSHTAGWNSSETKYFRSTSLSTGWSALLLVNTIPTSSDSFNTQNDFFITVNGTKGTTYIYAGDRWSEKTGVGIGKNAWYPLTFDGTGAPTLHGYGTWSIDAVTGLWSANNGGPIPDGTYKIINNHSAKGMDATNQGTANGTVIQQWTYGSAANQKWTLYHLGNNQYSIVGVQSGRVVEVAGAATTDGAGIVLWDDTGAANQKWTITATTGGYYKVINVNSGKGLNVAGSSLTDGADLEQWTYNGWGSQQWAFQAP